MKPLLKLRVNGEDYEMYIEPWRTLQEVLREEKYFEEVRYDVE